MFNSKSLHSHAALKALNYFEDSFTFILWKHMYFAVLLKLFAKISKGQ